MQTFLPYPNLVRSFFALDYKRLGKQRVEAMQIINVLTDVQTTKGWRNHPAVRMWENNIDALKLYHDLSIIVWKARKYNNGMKFMISDDINVLDQFKPEMPWWMGDENMHRSHRARLIEKNKDYYLPQFPDDEGYNDGKYFWPVNSTKTFKIIPRYIGKHNYTNEKDYHVDNDIMKKTFTLLLVLLPFFLFSQVQLLSHDATKIYPDDTRITYMQVSDYPIDNDFLQFVEKEVLTNTLIQRFSLSKNGGTCFFHSHKDITEEMIVEAINEAYYLYFTTETYKSKKENHSKVFNQNNPDKLISKEDFDKFTEKERAGIPISKDEYEEAVARKKNEKSNEKENNKKFISQANIKPISALNQIKWEKGGIFEGFSPKDEILEKRTQNTKHFQKDNGNIVAQIGGNYHYQDENNLWQDIDFTITKTNANGFAYSNITNTVKTYFPESAGDKGVSISDKSMDIKIWQNPELLIYDANKNILHKESSLNNSAKVKDNIVQYQSFNGIIDEIKIIDKGIENNIIIDNLQDQWTSLFNAKILSFKQFVELSDGVKILNSKGNIITNDFSDEFIGLQFADGQILYLNPLIVFDAQSNKDDAQLFYGLEDKNKIPEEIKAKAKSFHNGIYTIKFVENGIEIYSDVSLDWLQQAQYPVTIDPTWTVGSTASGTYYGPMTHWWGFQRHASLYLQSEIGGYGTITQVEYYKTNTADARTKPTKVYMRNITDATITSTNAWNSTTYTTGATACFNGNTTQDNTVGWKAIPLSTLHDYNTGNLLVMVYDAYGGNGGAQYMAQASASDLQMYKRQDGSDPGDGTAMETESRRTTIRLTYGTASDPCTSAITMQCGVTYNASLTSPGGEWTNYTDVSWNYPGTEQVWSFTAPTTGSYTFNVNEGTNDADFFLMASCSNTGTNLSSGYWTGSGGTSHTVTLSAGVTYYLIADLHSSNSSTTVTVSVDCSTPVSPCTPSFSSTSDYITNFSLGSINNSTGFSTGGYGNYTGQSTNLNAGATVNASLTSSSGSGTHAAAIWIDFNDNGVFEASERVGTKDGIGPSETVSIPIVIPTSANLGSHKLRVVYQYNVAATSITPCASASYGEGEDYTIVIPCTPSFGSSTDYWITNVTTTGGTSNINNSTTGTGGAYNDYFNTHTHTANAGSTVSFSVNFNSTSSTYGVGIWVDWNNNDVFEASERVFATSSYTSPPITGSFAIPSTQPSGQYRMRVNGDWFTASPNDPCYVNYGEIEDYKFIVIENPCDNITAMNCGTTYTATLQPNSGYWTNYTGSSLSWSGSEQVWAFTAPTTGSYTFNLNQGSADADFFLMAACDPNSTNLSNGYWYGGSSGSSNTVTLTGGVTYYLIADLYSSSSTTVTVSVDCPSPCNPIATATGTTSICGGDTATYSVTCTGGTGTPTYQWYFKTPFNGSTFTALTNTSTGSAPCYTYISGATSSSLTIGLYSFSSACSGYQVYCKVSYSGSGCNQAISDSITTTVSSTNTVSAASSTPTLCINTSLTAITHTTTGATGIGTATGLPAGVTASWASNTITISGTPPASGTFNYSIPLTGGCGSVNATGTITVNPNASIVLTSASGSNVQSICIKSPISNITYLVTDGGTGAGVTGLPAGVSGSFNSGTFTISGTPSVSGTYNYTITTTGTCTQTNTTGTITVNPPQPDVALSANDYLWYGSTNTTWENDNNWLKYNGVNYSIVTFPTSANNVIISAGTGCVSSNQPTISTAGALCANLTISSSGTLTIAEGKKLAVTGNLTNNGTITSNTGTGSIDIKGNWTNNGIFTCGMGTVTFNGSDAQLMGGSVVPETFYNLSINNTSSTGLTFNKTGKVTNKLTLTDGIIYTCASNLLILTDSAYASKGTTTDEYKLGGSVDSYIDGPVKKIGGISTAITTYDNYHSFIIPIGKNGKWAPVLISHFSNSTATDEFTAEYFKEGYGDYDLLSPLDRVSSVEWWDIKQDVGNSVKKIYLFAKDLEFSGITNIADENLVIAHYKSSAGSWESCGRTTSGSDFVESGYWSDFTSPFTFGSKNNNNPLPISLLKFDVACENNKVNITWTTSTETNNDYFTLERSINGVDFEAIAQIQGQGNSNQIINYSYLDEIKHQGIVYYRLIQTDFDGSNQVYPMISANCSQEADIRIMPNPFKDIVYVSGLPADCLIEIFGAKGERIQLFKNHEANLLEMNLEHLSPGIYFVKILENNGQLKVVKLIKN